MPNDIITPAAADVPAAVTPPAAPPAPPTQPQSVQPAAAVSAAPIGITSEQLKQRLDEERAKAEKRAREDLLKQIGFSSVDEASAAAKAARDAAEAQKSELQRLMDAARAAQEAADAHKKRLDALEPVVKARAESEYSRLSDEQRAAVDRLAGEDAAQRLRVIETLSPTWARAAATAPVTAPTAAPAPAPAPAPGILPPLPPPASTSAAGGAPPSVGAPVPTNHKAQYESLRANNPAAAALYLAKHHKNIFPTQ